LQDLALGSVFLFATKSLKQSLAAEVECNNLVLALTEVERGLPKLAAQVVRLATRVVLELTEAEIGLPRLAAQIVRLVEVPS
jgi:hypothetical protein